MMMIASFLWALFFIGFSSGVQATYCHGRFLNPITQINWNMVFPIRIAGKRIKMHASSVDSDRTVQHKLCMCSGRFLGFSIPGIMVTYHAPLYVAEIAKVPGCLSSLGGLSLLSGYASEQSDLQENRVRWQVHWYRYPVLSLLHIFKKFLCSEKAKFSLAYLSELDPTWQNDAWGAVYAPESVLFANIPAQQACAVDAIASSRQHPKDAMFWCAGSWGSVYPLTGNVNANAGRIQSAQLVMAKMMARLARMGFLQDSVGSDQICHKNPMDIWVKSEFSLDPVYPIVHHGAGVVIGAPTPLWAYRPPQTYPLYENMHQVVFQEQQCCIRWR